MPPRYPSDVLMEIPQHDDPHIAAVSTSDYRGDAHALRDSMVSAMPKCAEPALPIVNGSLAQSVVSHATAAAAVATDSSSLCPGKDAGDGAPPAADAATVAVGAVTALLALFIVAVVLGNLLVVVSVCRERRLRTAANAFVVNLAVADLLVGVAVMPFALSQYALGGLWPYGRAWCDLWRCLDVLGCTASILTLCAIATHKYWSIREPLAYPRSARARLRTAATVALVWLASAAASFPAIAWWRAVDGPMPDEHCEFTSDRAYVIFSSLLSFYIPSAVMLVVYWRIYAVVNCKLRALTAGTVLVGFASTTSGVGGRVLPLGKRGCDGEADYVELRVHKGGSCANSGSAAAAANRYSNSGGSSGTKAPFRGERGGGGNSSVAGGGSETSLYKKVVALARERKAATTLGIVIGVFLLCWMPFFTCHLINALCNHVCLAGSPLLDVVTWFGYANSGANPVIYALSMREFRRAFARTLGGNGYATVVRNSGHCFRPSRRKFYIRQALPSSSSTSCSFVRPPTT